MTWTELIAWMLILGWLVAMAWLMVKAGRRLWARRSEPAQPARVRWLDPLAITPPGQSSRQSEVHQPVPANVQMGPPRWVKVDMEEVFREPWLRRGEPLVIRPHPDPLWVEKGWRQEGNTYYGQFRANGRSWRGMIQVPYPGGYQAYIWDPPLQALDGHPHRPCFMDPRPDGRYQVHFRSAPTSVDHAIANIEQILQEAVGA